MSAQLEKLMHDIEVLVDLKITDRFTRNPLDVNTEAISFAQFEAEQMVKFDGNEFIDHGFFRSYLRWMEQYYAYHLNGDVDIIRQSITIEDITKGIYTAPDATEFTGLSPVLDEIFTRINTNSEAITDIQGDIITLNNSLGNFGDDLEVLSGNVVTLSNSFDTHSQNQAIHLEPDSVSLIADATKIKIKDSYVRGLFSASNPIALSAGGALSLKIDPATLEIDAITGNLKVIGGTGGGGSAYGLSFNSGTNVLSLVENGQNLTVDLTSLASGGVDLGNYVKLTGAANQQINGNVTVTGQLTAMNEITAFGADYAEYFEWADGNSKKEDRTGLLVRINEEGKIELYNPWHCRPDGAISATPSVIGNDPAEWPGKYKKDSLGRIVRVSGIPVISEEFNGNRQYIRRKHRKEWSPVGLLGRLRLILDIEHSDPWADKSYVIPSFDGKVKFSNEPSEIKYRVIKLINTEVVEVFFK